MATKSYAVDTNILLFATDRQSPHFEACDKILEQGKMGHLQLFLADKTLYEFYAVLSNLLALKKQNIDQAVDVFEYYLNCDYLKLLDSSPNTAGKVLELLRYKSVKGKYIHDIALIAMILENNLDGIYTFNEKDFLGIPGLEVIVPE